MHEDNPKLEDVLELAVKLSPDDKKRLVELVQPHIDREDAAASRTPRKSARGIWADLGPAPSEEDIAEMRQEAWKNFPREDI